MCPRTEIPAVQVGAIRRAMLAGPNKFRFQRLQCLWLRTRQDLPTKAIAQTVGLSSHVRRVWSDYLRGGLAGAQGRPKGGRRHQNLTVAQEQALLAPWRQGLRGAGWSPPGVSKSVAKAALAALCPTRRCIGCWLVTRGVRFCPGPSTRGIIHKPERLLKKLQANLIPKSKFSRSKV